MTPTLVWYRRDLRISDHPALSAAVARGGAVIPVFIRDGLVDNLLTAPQWRLGLGVGHLAQTLEDQGSRLILRSGDAVEVLSGLVEETGAGAVYWSRAYDPASVERDTKVKSALKETGVEASSFEGHLMFEPWTVETKTGAFYKVYTPFWKAVRERSVADPLPAPESIPGTNEWPDSETLEDWQLGVGMRRGAEVVRPFVRLGEQAAQDRLAKFIDEIVAGYGESRDMVAQDGTSNLSENLSLGEISPAQCWHAGQVAMQDGKPGAEVFLKELVWREFAYHLMWHTPRLLTDNWREEWDAFPWSEDEETEAVIRWKQGRTGLQFVDAAMRELYTTGRMHNRGRMIVASYLTKHLMTDWKVGLKWFEDCLIDWDPASNAMGWQWSAGSGPDSTPYFRVFNPVTQLDKFDPKGRYRQTWLAETSHAPSDTALAFFDAIPEAWGLSPQDSYPDPVVTAEEGRKRALDAYQSRDF